MEKTNFDSLKVVKKFAVIGLNETKLTKYTEQDQSKIRYVDNIDIVHKDMKIPVDKIEPNENEKWFIII